VRFFIDANLPRAVLAVFQKHGHDVSFARDIQQRDRWLHAVTRLNSRS
jgi:hypothetical protein